MSAKKTADAAIIIAEEALTRVQSAHRASPISVLIVLLGIAYIAAVNYTNVPLPALNKHAKIGIMSILLVGMVGMFGRTLERIFMVACVVFVASLLMSRHINHVEGMEDSPKKVDDPEKKLKELHARLSELTAKMSQVKKKTDVNPDEPMVEKMENMGNMPIGYDGAGSCTPCQGGIRDSFGPKPFTPSSDVMGEGNDSLPPMGVDFLSAPPGVYAQSQIGYGFGMA